MTCTKPNLSQGMDILNQRSKSSGCTMYINKGMDEIKQILVPEFFQLT